MLIDRQQARSLALVPLRGFAGELPCLLITAATWVNASVLGTIATLVADLTGELNDAGCQDNRWPVEVVGGFIWIYQLTASGIPISSIKSGSSSGAGASGSGLGWRPRFFW